MSDQKTFASLSPALLARKGGARPAMRSQLQPLPQFNDAVARQLDDDLGWNDMGHDHAPPAPVAAAAPFEADIVPIQPALEPAAAPVKPVVVRQQEEVSRRVSVAATSEPRQRRSALTDGRRAAFTLRVDAERHLKLRLACTLRNRSAQQLVTEALDHLLADLPDVTELAARVASQRA